MSEAPQLNLLVQNPIMTATNPHLLPDFNEDAVPDDDDEFGNFVDEEDLEKNKQEEESSEEESDDDSVCSLQKIGNNKKAGSSINRNASWLSFVSRSERARILGKEKPPPPEEEQRRKVHFVDEEKLETVHEVDPIEAQDKRNYWMSGEDFDRLENELKLTRFRWENHKNGKIKLDERTTTIRGLELMLKDQALKEARGVQPWQHTKSVLGEIHRQKLDEKEIDWEKVRNESLRSSAKGVENGYVTGKEDEVARIRAWDPSIKPPANLNSSSKNDGKKKKKGGFFSFLNGGKK